jgi:hypothetical protein
LRKLGATLTGDSEDQVPEVVLGTARSAFRRERVHEVATITFDSLIDADDPPEDHRLRFEHRLFMIEVRVLLEGGSVTISGVVDPPVVARALLHFEESSDVPFVSRILNGRFAFVPTLRGLNRLSFEGLGQPEDVWTDWFRT